MRKQKDLNILTFEGMESWQGYLSKAKIELLRKTWAGTFRKYILPKLPVEELSEFYVERMGRPTKDLLTAIGAAVLQQVFDLTDAETREQLAFNQQWHFALETYNPEEQLFSEKTLWTIRYHLTKENIGQSIFQNVTDNLIKTLKVDISKQRMDSVHVYSNMAKLGRVRLISRTITKFLKNLKRHNAEGYKSDIPEQIKERYIKRKGTGYFGNVKPSESQKRLLEIAEDLQNLIEIYSCDQAIMKMSSYKLMERVFIEQCVIKGGKIKLKPSKEITSDSIQNPSDIDAGYDGHKGQGYQVQLSETYNRKEKLLEGEEKETKKQGRTKDKEVLDLITYVKVESADKHDSKALVPTIEEMDERGIKPEEILVDAAYGGDENVMKSEGKRVKVISPVIGKKSKKDFSEFEFDGKTKEVKRCADGKSPQSVKRNKSGIITVIWSEKDCLNCSLQENCRTKKGALGRRLVYTKKEIRLWQRRQYQDSHEFKDKYRYRAGIEATNARYIHMTGARRVRYRGQEKVEFAEVMKALGINMFRVLRYVLNTGKIFDSIMNIFYKNTIFPIFCILKNKFRIFCNKYELKLYFAIFNQLTS